MAPFSGYVLSLHSLLEKLGDSTELCVVAGNETCDVDSIVSAVVYAHYISATGSYVTGGTVTLPLVQCRRAELSARMDAALLLEELGVEEAWLLFLDDITPELLSKVGQLSIVLVDHNEPTGILSSFVSQVTRVVDHHQKTGLSSVDRDGVTSVLELVGSCSALVARELLNNDSYEIEECVARGLASVVLSDTGKLLTEGRVTDTDISVVKGLSNILPSSFDNDKQYAKYISAKFDISKLSVREVLERDFKEERYNDHYVVRFCSITSKLSEYLTQPGAKEAIAAFYSDHGLSALIVFGVSIKDIETVELEKQVAVYQPEGEHYEFTESLTIMFESSKEIRCERLEGLGEFDGVIMQQGNLALSRKQIIPIFTKFMKSIDVISLSAISPEFPAEGLSPPMSPHQPSGDPYPLEPRIDIVSKTAVSMATVGEATATGGAKGEGDDSPPSKDKGASKSRGRDIIPEYTAAEESKDRTYRFVSVGGDETIISMAMVEPYKKLVQHAGYVGESRMALLIISAAHLPPRSLPNYQHVLHHTFYYMLSMVDKLIVDNYMIVYFHSGAPKRSMPSVPILHKFYKMIDRRLKKQLMKLYIVHPTFWVKCVIKLARPLLSKKFWRKVHFVPTLEDLSSHVAVDKDYIPESVYAKDLLLMASMHPDSRQKHGSQKEEQSGPTEKEEKKEKQEEEA